MSPSNTHAAFPYSPSTLVELLRWRAVHQPDRRAYTFLADGEAEEVSVTYGELDRQARAIAAGLRSLRLQGERGLLLYPQGLEHIAAFFGCLYAEVVAIPLYPPRLKDRSLSRVRGIVKDAQATLALTTSSILSRMDPVVAQAPELKTLRWLATDALVEGAEGAWQEPGVTKDTLAFLQYTSGSTDVPRGVIESHSNLLSNLASMYRTWGLTPSSVLVSWTPMFHDMGLIMGILLPCYGGFPVSLMSPAAFLQRPFRWPLAISRHKATFSFGPNFAFDLCVRKITPEQRARLDLRSWTLAINGAEPVRPETIECFVAAFGPWGFRRDAFYPGYGLAEATVAVSCGRKTTHPLVKAFRKAAFDRHELIPASGGTEPVRRLAGCGRPLPEQRVVIADPDSLTTCPPDRIGEIWISGPSMAQGYWRRPEETEQTFRASLSDTGEGPFLRTGDLGFLQDGELFITGRIKDLIIIRGQNHYPQDIERAAEQSHPALRPGGTAAFSIEAGGQEQLLVVQEVEYRQQPDVEAVVGAIRQAVTEEHGVQVHAVVLVKPGTIPKTSSGKIQRRACRAAFLSGGLELWGALEECAGKR